MNNIVAEKHKTAPIIEIQFHYMDMIMVRLHLNTSEDDKIWALFTFAMMCIVMCIGNISE